MPRKVLLLSIRPQFTRQILEGNKSVELRRSCPKVHAGQRVLIYSSAPTMAFVATAAVERIMVGKPDLAWAEVAAAAGLSREEYNAYFVGAEQATAIWLCEVRKLRPVPLERIRERWPWFSPPQSYRYVEASFRNQGEGLRSLSPVS